MHLLTFARRVNGTKNGNGSKDEGNNQQASGGDKKNGAVKLGSAGSWWVSTALIGMFAVLLV